MVEPSVWTKSTVVRWLLANSAKLLVGTGFSNVPKLITIQTDSIVTIVCRMTASIAFSASMLLTIVRKADKEFPKAKVGWDRCVYSDSKMTITIEDQFIKEISTATIADNFTEWFQSLDNRLVGQLMSRIIDI